MKLNSVECDLSILENLIKKLNTKKFVDVGILKDANYPDEKGTSVLLVGATHEFGSIDGNIPERSFIRMPLETGQKEIEKKLAPKMQGFLDKQDVDGFLKILGIECEARIQDAFDTGGFGTWQALDPKTVRAKGGSTAILIKQPVILRKSITSQVGGG